MIKSTPKIRFPRNSNYKYHNQKLALRCTWTKNTTSKGITSVSFCTCTNWAVIYDSAVGVLTANTSCARICAVIVKTCLLQGAVAIMHAIKLTKRR